MVKWLSSSLLFVSEKGTDNDDDDDDEDDNDETPFNCVCMRLIWDFVLLPLCFI